MPRRPRPHQIEDISRRRFEDIIPDNWVFRSKDKDYGIDAEVEIFDDNNEATGLLFYVQLKATDSEELSVQRQVTLRVDSLKYFNSLDLPVLIARYAVKTNKFYCEWSENILLTKNTSKSISFSEKDIYDLKKIKEIEASIYCRKRIIDKDLSFPFGISLNFNENDNPYFQFSAKKELLLNKNFIEKKYEFYIEISDTSVKIFLGTFKYKKKYEKESVSDLVEKIYLIILELLLKFKQYKLIPEIIYNSSIKDYLFQNDDKLIIFLPFLLESKYSSVTVKNVTEGYIKNSLTLSYFYFLLWRINTTDDNIEDLFEKNISKIKKENDNKRLAIEYYNFANFLGNNNYNRRAIHYYNKTRKLDPTYLERPYFLNELAGCFFYSKKFNVASKLYNISLKNKHDDIILARHADSLMFSGNYSKAILKFKLFMGSDIDQLEKEKWNLKFIVLSELISKFEINHQKRQVFEARKLFNDINGSDDVIYNKCLTSLELDFLYNLSWYNLGYFYKESEALIDASFCFMMAGICQPDDYQAWANAIEIHWRLLKERERTNDYFFILTLREAYFYNGEEFLNYLYSECFNYNNQLIEVFEGIISEIVLSSGLSRTV